MLSRTGVGVPVHSCALPALGAVLTPRCLRNILPLISRAAVVLPVFCRQSIVKGNTCARISPVARSFGEILKSCRR